MIVILSLQVCFDGPLDQHYVRFPQELLNPAHFESAILDPSNPHVLNGKTNYEYSNSRA